MYKRHAKLSRILILAHFGRTLELVKQETAGAEEWMVLTSDSASVLKCGYVTLNGVSTDRRIKNYSPC
jgi:hypothetical protein